MRFKYYLRGAGIGVIVATLVLSIAFLFHDDISDEEVIRRAMKLGMVMQESNSGTLSDIPPSGASKADLETGMDPLGSTKADEDPLGQAGGDTSADGPDAAGSGAGTQADPDGQAPDDSSTAADDPSAGQDGQADGADTDGDTGTASGGSGDKPSGGNEGSKDDNENKGGNGNHDNKDDKEEKDSQTDDPKPDDREDASDEVEIVIESGDVSRMVSAKVFEAGLVDDAAEFNAFLGANDYDNMLQPGRYKIKKGASFREIARILTRQ